MTFHRWFAGFFLLILMVMALFANSILFSARSFQDNLAHIAPDTGGVIRIADLDAVESQVAMLKNQTAPQRGELSQLELRAATAKRDVDSARDAIVAVEVRILTRTAELEGAAGLTPGAGAGAFDAVDVAQRLDRVSAQRASAAATAEGIAAVRADLAKLPELEQSLSAREDDLAQIEAERSRASEFVSTSERTILGLQGQFGGDFTRVRNEAQALVASTPFGWGQKVVEMHPAFLSTLLVLIMGALGALLYLFPAYLNRDNRIFFADIVVRLVFGMVVALAFYIVANASLAGFAFVPGGETGATGASLNPFTVSLIGIIAGIMADDIAAWILKRGRELLGGGFPETSARTPAPPAPNRAPAQQRSTRPAPEPMGVNPNAGAPDPYGAAAQDARTAARPAAPSGDSPPRGGVVG
ncbi:MAG: hypothetical protein NW200_04650 [Hyphomonadaceae bacterium]|nr:hypothetical protein [Hyphomonadaceae bacterium]